MGTRGPVGKRSDQRRRTNKPAVPVDTAPGAPTVEVPEADPSWHPVALAWYQSLAESGQARFYEPSDWAVAVLIAESMSRDLQPQAIGIAEKSGEVVMATIPLKGASLSAYLRAFGVLMVTEGDRRRLAVELGNPDPVDPEAERANATVTNIRDALTGA